MFIFKGSATDEKLVEAIDCFRDHPRCVASETVKTVRLIIVDDIQAESDESFYLNLVQATNTVIGTGQAGGTIIDND